MLFQRHENKISQTAFGLTYDSWIINEGINTLTNTNYYKAL